MNRETKPTMTTSMRAAYNLEDSKMIKNHGLGLEDHWPRP